MKALIKVDSTLKIFIIGCLINPVFFLIDWLWISLLPVIQVSFGAILPQLILFTVLRAGILFAWSVLLLALSQRKPVQGFLSRYLFLIVLNLVLLGFGLYGSIYEPSHLTVSQAQVPVQGLNRTLRIVQLSDLHIERTSVREQALPQLVTSLNPDMIVMTGDFLNEDYAEDPLAVSALRDLVVQLHAPLGVYAVNGNVGSPTRLKEMFSGLEVSVLDNEIVYFTQDDRDFAIVGLSLHCLCDDGSTLTQLLTQLNPGDFSILLYHTPDLAYLAEQQGVNLYLAGHTHGGQIRLPFYGAPYTNSEFGKTFEMGLYRLSDTYLFISRGIGFTGSPAPRIRFLAPPEVAVIDLVPEK